MRSTNSVVHLREHDGIGVVIVDNPPVNALSHAVRAGLREAFGTVAADHGLRAAVLMCSGRTFIAGADIAEFDRPPRPPSNGDLIAVLEAMGKPVIAALHGTALGGGLELALGCHYRVAAPRTKLGFPEIRLGLIPGAGGTQRLPRIVGVEKALAMILNGEPIDAEEAQQCGLLDAILTGQLDEESIAFARKILSEGAPLKRVRDSDHHLAAWRADPSRIDELTARHLQRSNGRSVAVAAIDAIRAALKLPFDEALENERKIFVSLRDSDESRAQRYVFFAERQTKHVANMPVQTTPHEIAQAAVIGAGTMGRGIAMCFANAGIPVTVIDVGAEPLARGLESIAKTYRDSVARRRLTSDEMDRRLARIQGATDFAAVATADLVIEAVFEDFDLKRSVFRDLDRLAPAQALLATNTSYLDVNAIAAVTQRPESVLGMHFFSPANVMRLLEVVRGAKTSPQALASAMAVGRRLGKVPVVVGVCHGFVGNRMLRQRSVQAERLLLEGALPQEVDRVLVDFGFPMGPFAMSDLAGLDVSWRMRKAFGLRAEIADALCEAGRFGQKSGRGFYRYDPDSRAPQPDPEVEQLIVAVSQRLGIMRRVIAPETMLERLIYPMINEGARILEEGIAQRPGDIDVVWVYGYGWPAWRGGPMYYADRTGLDRVRQRLSEFAEAARDPSLNPAPLLSRLADAGATFTASGSTRA
ncbi:MAG TPA: 3-hydroxyacyl-CoA dehydrogenase NAD-binding domain-containing protein [Xanthobacteraceae bacterium]|nr:3-hydroxyacyl-CoA dehydrogenase NAD-binding domain-containing protein [Xanthobacteraceae bacterium]